VRTQSPSSILWPALLAAGIGCTAEPGDDTADCDVSTMDPIAMMGAVMDGHASACQAEDYERLLQARAAETRGPWSSSIRVVASDDGLAFDTQAIQEVLPFAGVPELILHDGAYSLFYVDGDLDRAAQLAYDGSDWFSTHGLGGFGALRMASSSDGYAYSEVDDFEIRGLERGQIVDPDIIRLPDGRWRLYYLVVPLERVLEVGIWEHGTPHDVYYAESDDLIHWEQVGHAAHGPFADPTVHCGDDDSCLMMSYGLDSAISTDGGASFEFLGEHEIYAFAPELTAFDDSTLRLYATSRVEGAPIHSYWLDDDGETWNPDGGERLPAWTGEAPSLAPGLDGGWLMAHHMDWNIEDGERPDDGEPEGAD